MKKICISLSAVVLMTASQLFASTGSFEGERVDDVNVISNESTNSQLNQLRNLVQIATRLQAEGQDAFEPCTYASTILSIASAWPRTIFDVILPDFEIMGLAAQAQNLIQEATDLARDNQCLGLKPDDKCCRRANNNYPADTCLIHKGMYCKLVKMTGGDESDRVCNAAAEKCVNQE